MDPRAVAAMLCRKRYGGMASVEKVVNWICLLGITRAACDSELCCSA